ncbi:MAG TPA: glutamate-cysteine ligase family protein [Sulfuricella sp.]|nr:glutamate-cysteine ligase family protein [Sulfuricella sp.]
MSTPLHAFAGYGIELEYMIVDRHTLSVLPVADELLRRMAGSRTSELRMGGLALSNELVMHLIELKNTGPESALALKSLSSSFQAEIRHVNKILEPLNARLMPTAMHPWMNPSAETRLWPHDNTAIYRAYDRIFDCKRHGWANLQSMHLNLPFAGDNEFARLHAAIRLVLPILPALAASSPFAEGRNSGFLDYRMENYRTHQARVASTIGQVIPATAMSCAGYDSQVMQPMYREIAALDPESVLHHEWLNVRGAAPRFERSAIEIRVIDVQECPLADFAIAAAVANLVGTLYDARWTPFAEQQEIGTDALAGIMLACIRDADQADIANAAYLRLLGLPDRRCKAGELWQHLVETMSWGYLDQRSEWQEPLDVILRSGPLARRILRATGTACDRSRLEDVYRQLCDCLAEGRMFHG